MTAKLVMLLYQSWSDLDQALASITPGEASARPGGCSSIAWTLGHVTTSIDWWLNMRFQHLPPNPVINNPDFRTGGSGNPPDWSTLRKAVDEVRASAKRILDTKQDADVEHVIPYDGDIQFLRETGLSLRYALLAIASHHWVHTGEILTVRSMMGWHEPGEADWGRSLI